MQTTSLRAPWSARGLATALVHVVCLPLCRGVQAAPSGSVPAAHGQRRPPGRFKLLSELQHCIVLHVCARRWSGLRREVMATAGSEMREVSRERQLRALAALRREEGRAASQAEGPHPAEDRAPRTPAEAIGAAMANRSLQAEAADAAMAVVNSHTKPRNPLHLDTIEGRRNLTSDSFGVKISIFFDTFADCQ